MSGAWVGWMSRTSSALKIKCDDISAHCPDVEPGHVCRIADAGGVRSATGSYRETAQLQGYTLRLKEKGTVEASPPRRFPMACRRDSRPDGQSSPPGERRARLPIRPEFEAHPAVSVRQATGRNPENGPKNGPAQTRVSESSQQLLGFKCGGFGGGLAFEHRVIVLIRQGRAFAHHLAADHISDKNRVRSEIHLIDDLRFQD